MRISWIVRNSVVNNKKNNRKLKTKLNSSVWVVYIDDMFDILIITGFTAFSLIITI